MGAGTAQSLPIHNDTFDERAEPRLAPGATRILFCPNKIAVGGKSVAWMRATEKIGQIGSSPRVEGKGGEGNQRGDVDPRPEGVFVGEWLPGLSSQLVLIM